MAKPHLDGGPGNAGIDILKDVNGIGLETVCKIQEGKFQVGLRSLAHEGLKFRGRSRLPHCQRIHGVLGEDLFKTGAGFGLFAHCLEDKSLEVKRLEVPAVVSHGFLYAVKGHGKIAVFHIHLRKLGVCAGIVHVVPGSAVKGVVCGGPGAFGLEDKAKVVNGLSILRAGIILCLPGYCRAKILLCLLKVSPLPVVDAHLGVGTGVAGIAAKDLQEIVRRVDVRVMELEVPKAHQIAFLRVFNVLWTHGAFYGFRQRGRRVMMNRSIGIKEFSGFVV